IPRGGLRGHRGCGGMQAFDLVGRFVKASDPNPLEGRWPMIDRLPFPIAFSYHLIGAARDPTMRYERLVHCYDAVVRYCAAVQVRTPWSPDESQRRFREHKGPILDRLLAELDFLARYTLYVPYRGPSPGVVREAFVLMGPTDPPRLELDMDLRLTIKDQSRFG